MSFGEHIAHLRASLDRPGDIVEQIDRRVLSVREGAGFPRELSRVNEQLAAAGKKTAPRGK